MGVIPTLRSIRREDYADAPEWFARFLEVLSPYVNEVTQALGGGLDPINLGRQFADVSLTTSSTLATTFGPGKVVIKNKLGFKPRAVMLGKCQPKTAPSYAQETWTAPTFQNGWVDYGAPYFSAAYCLRNGRVYLRGLVKNGTLGSVIFTLPVGFRPASDIIFPTNASGNTYGSGRVLATGAVQAATGAVADWSLDGVSFEPAAGTWSGIGPFGQPQWSLTTNGTIQIDYISGLSPNTDYDLTFVLE